MPGLPNGAGMQQTPVPVPVPPILQAQGPAQQSNASISAPGTSGVVGTPSAPAESKVPVTNVAPSANAQASQAPAQQQVQPFIFTAPKPVAQTPVPAPSPLKFPAALAALPAPAALPTTLPTPLPLPATPSPIVATTTNTKKVTPPRQSSPVRPKMEPLTPPLGPVQFPPPRQSHAYPNHPEQQVIIAPPAPEPIQFDSNPDVLALQSAISILQMQSAKAQRDMVALQKAKNAALADPGAFIKDLESGKVRMGASGLEATLGDDDEDDSSDDEAADGLGKGVSGQNGVKSEGDAMAVDKKPKRQKPEPKSWSQLPNKQNVVRMPPINWSQYAVVGGSLDKLHNEQVARPSQGTPATISADGTYMFQGVGRQEEYNGIAAPFDPLKDKLVKKPRSKTPSRQG